MKGFQSLDWAGRDRYRQNDVVWLDIGRFYVNNMTGSVDQYWCTGIVIAINKSI